MDPDTIKKALVTVLQNPDNVEHDEDKFGTGFVINIDDGKTYILTCAHVLPVDINVPVTVKDANSIKEAKILAIGTAESVDLAVLLVEEILNVQILAMSNHGKKDRRFITGGFQSYDRNSLLIRPLEGRLVEENTIESKKTSGRIKVWDIEINSDSKFKLKPGYSGSPIVDLETSMVVGVITRSHGDGSSGLAISVEEVKKIWPQIPGALLRDIKPKQSVKPSNEQINKHIRTISIKIEQAIEHDQELIVGNVRILPLFLLKQIMAVLEFELDEDQKATLVSCGWNSTTRIWELKRRYSREYFESIASDIVKMYVEIFHHLP